MERSSDFVFWAFTSRRLLVDRIRPAETLGVDGGKAGEKQRVQNQKVVVEDSDH